MVYFSCPYLHGEVELSAERETHIAERHPELLPALQSRIAETLSNPDQVRWSVRAANAHLLSRSFPDLKRGKNVVVVVVTEDSERHWIITAYVTKNLAEGDIVWKRS